jgi:prophage DNA circulation protein
MSNPQRWKDKLRPASFRGVRFFVDNINIQGGRRGADHEFPDREEPYAEDSGRKQRKYPVDAYLVGKDYFAARNKLIQALEKPGSADLVHPYYGRKKVVCRSFDVVEQAGAGGFVRIQISFVEAGSLIFPKANADRAFLVGLAGAVLGESAASALEDAFDVADKAQFVIDSATDKMLEITAQMDSLSAGISGAADPLAEFAFAVRSIRSSAEDLVRSPSVLAANLGDAFKLLLDAIDPADAYAFSRGFFGFGSSDSALPTTTATRISQALSLGSLNTFVKTLAAIGAANAAVGMTFKSYDDAVSVRDDIGDHLDNLMAGTSDDNVFSALLSLRSQLVQAVPNELENLARISEVTPQTTIPSLTMAYELYGSVDQEQDLIDRNGIAHPGFIMGGKTLEVLDNV